MNLYECMFYGCFLLKEIIISNFNMEKVTKDRDCFYKYIREFAKKYKVKLRHYFDN